MSQASCSTKGNLRSRPERSSRALARPAASKTNTSPLLGQHPGPTTNMEGLEARILQSLATTMSSSLVRHATIPTPKLRAQQPPQPKRKSKKIRRSSSKILTVTQTVLALIRVILRSRGRRPRKRLKSNRKSKLQLNQLSKM